MTPVKHHDIGYAIMSADSSLPAAINKVHNTLTPTMPTAVMTVGIKLFPTPLNAPAKISTGV